MQHNSQEYDHHNLYGREFLKRKDKELEPLLVHV